MQISFSSRKLEKQLSSQREMNRAYQAIMPALQRRLAVLSVAETVADIPVTPPLRRHQLAGDLQDCFAISVTANVRLIFRPAQQTPPQNARRRAGSKTNYIYRNH